ncbi:hypothetical protein V8G54_026418 [Vigna mungo]|uniref:Uncharacterized protein n=1 Tax=Vigna mungo TaxID=3915 RepID=A0AAQ3RPW4_VIGMU
MNLFIDKKNVTNLLVMLRRNSLEKNFGFVCINLCIHPLTPCCQTDSESFHAIHVFQYLVTYLNIIPWLLRSCAIPPKPSVENQNVHVFPYASTLDGIELQNSTNFFLFYVNQMCGMKNEH